MKLRVYIAGPYTKPNPIDNLRRAIEFGNALMDAGYAVFVPHLSHFQHMVYERPWQEWIDHDLEWLAVCDVLVRMSGESAGAAIVVARARDLGIPVIYADTPAEAVAAVGKCFGVNP